MRSPSTNMLFKKFLEKLLEKALDQLADNTITVAKDYVQRTIDKGRTARGGAEDARKRHDQSRS